MKIYHIRVEVEKAGSPAIVKFSGEVPEEVLMGDLDKKRKYGEILIDELVEQLEQLQEAKADG